MARIALAAAVVAIAALSLSGCGIKPAQDYVVTGTLDASAELRRSMRAPIFDELTRYSTELVMTVRTSPDVGDVVVQRRWRNIGIPHEFGLGKGRGEAVKSRSESVYVTAMLTLRDPQRGFALGRFVGWTKKPVPVGSYHTHLELEWMFSSVDPALEGFPTGGWASPSVREEALPPGIAEERERDNDRAGAPAGAKVFAGTIDVNDPSKRSALMGCTLYFQARARAERGAPELIVQYDDPVFPFTFSMHENQRFFGDPVPVDDMEPVYVIAVLDRDGSVDSKDDQIRVTTETAVDPETFDLKLVFDLSDAPAALFADAGPTGPGGGNHPTPGGAAAGHGAPPQPTGHGAPAQPAGARGEHLVSGRIILPEDLATEMKPKSALWLSLRDGASDKLIFVSSVSDPSFPQEFDLHAGDNKFGGTVSIDAPFRVKAILTDGPVMKTGPGIFVVISEPITKGTKSIDLVLERSE